MFGTDVRWSHRSPDMVVHVHVKHMFVASERWWNRIAILINRAIVRPAHPWLRLFGCTSYTNNPGIEWQNWLRSFDAMIRACCIRDDYRKPDLLLFYGGQKAQQLFNTLPGLPSVQLCGPRLNVEQYTPNMTVRIEEAVAHWPYWLCSFCRKKIERAIGISYENET